MVQERIASVALGPIVGTADRAAEHAVTATAWDVALFPNIDTHHLSRCGPLMADWPRPPNRKPGCLVQLHQNQHPILGQHPSHRRSVQMQEISDPVCHRLAGLEASSHFATVAGEHWNRSVVRCQWPFRSANGRPAEMPAGGHENVPRMANHRRLVARRTLGVDRAAMLAAHDSKLRVHDMDFIQLRGKYSRVRGYMTLRNSLGTRGRHKGCTLSPVGPPVSLSVISEGRTTSRLLLAGSLRKQLNNVAVFTSGGPCHPQLACAVTTRVSCRSCRSNLRGLHSG